MLINCANKSKLQAILTLNTVSTMMQNLGQPFEESCCAAVNKDIEKI